MKRYQWISFLLFQIGWWSAAILVQRELAWIATAILFSLVGFHLALHHKRSEYITILIVALLGYSMDSLFHGLHLVDISPAGWKYLPHPWLLGLWALFATTVNHSMAWVFTKPLAAAVVGAVLGPATYYLAGEKFGLLSFASPLSWSLAWYAVAWAVLMLTLSLRGKIWRGFSDVDLK
jgi:hypothetical protein